MATKIVIGLATYLQDFTNGQVGFRTGDYVLYSTDLDTNFNTLRVIINQLIDEVAAVQGPNAGLGVDLLIFDDPERLSSGEPNDAAGANSTGFIGLASFEPNLTITSTADDSVHLDGGALLANGVVIRNASGATFVGTGGAGTRWFAVDVNGTLFQETAANQRHKDLFSINWNGTAFTGAFTRLQQVFFDGDEYEALRRRPAAGSSPVTLDARSFEAFHFRMEALERLVAGLTTDSLGNALGQPAIRVGSAGTPGLAVAGDPNTGIYQAAADELNFSAGGAQKFRVNSAELEAFVDIHAFSGTVTHPGYTFSSDHDTGMWLPGANRLSFATGGVARGEFDAEGNLDLPTNARVKGVRTAAQSITDATATLVSFTAVDEFEVGFAHNHSGGAPGDQEFTVPTGADGLYAISFNFEWNAPGAGVTCALTCEVTVGGASPGTPIQEKFEQTAEPAQPVSGNITVMRLLNAGDIVRCRVTQDSSDGSALDLQTASLSIVKVA